MTRGSPRRSRQRREIRQEEIVSELLQAGSRLTVKPERATGKLLSQIEPPENRLNFRDAAQVGTLLNDQPQLTIQYIGLLEQVQRSAQVTRLTVNAGNELEVARLLLLQSLFSRYLQRAVQCRQGQMGFSQCVVCGAQLAQRVLF